MGRKRLRTENTKIGLFKGQKERIAALYGTYGVSKFVRETVEERLTVLEAEVKAGTRQPAPTNADGVVGRRRRTADEVGEED